MVTAKLLDLTSLTALNQTASCIASYSVLKWPMQQADFEKYLFGQKNYCA
jgi:hypothetical protein